MRISHSMPRKLWDEDERDISVATAKKRRRTKWEIYMSIDHRASNIFSIRNERTTFISFVCVQRWWNLISKHEHWTMNLAATPTLYWPSGEIFPLNKFAVYKSPKISHFSPSHARHIFGAFPAKISISRHEKLLAKSFAAPLGTNCMNWTLFCVVSV